MKHQQYETELLNIFNTIPEDKKDLFIISHNNQVKSPTVVFGWSVMLGMFGADRFALGQIFIGLLKLFTFGGFYIWYIVDLFLVVKTARRNNIEKARELAARL
jgi:TM2 domain-containing membrane protein YozV